MVFVQSANLSSTEGLLSTMIAQESVIKSCLIALVPVGGRRKMIRSARLRSPVLGSELRFKQMAWAIQIISITPKQKSTKFPKCGLLFSVRNSYKNYTKARASSSEKLWQAICSSIVMASFCVQNKFETLQEALTWIPIVIILLKIFNSTLNKKVRTVASCKKKAAPVTLCTAEPQRNHRRK